MEINELFCLGCNKYGQLGTGKKYHKEKFTIPKSIVYPAFIKQVVCGVNHSALLTLQGNVYVMGSNMHGTLTKSPSSLNYSYSPVLVSELNDVTKICSGAYHMCAIANNCLYSWGKGLDGQLGNSSFTNCHTPKQIQPFQNEAQQVSCGSNHTLVKASNKKCYAFGNGIYGQLGVGSNKNYDIPTIVKIDEVDEICAGQNFSLFLKDGNIYGTGDNSKAQISKTIKKKCLLQPHKTQLTNITLLRSGKFSAAVSNNKNIYIWGLINHQSQNHTLQLSDQILDMKIGGQSLFYSTIDGRFHEIQLSSEQPTINTIMANTQAILDFDAGEKHCLILGDIVGEIQSIERPQTLMTMQQIQDLNNTNNLSNPNTNKSSTSNLSRSISISRSRSRQCTLSNSQSSSSINSQHFSRTPSSIMRQPSNFLKQEKRKQKSPPIQVQQFIGEIGPSFSKISKNTNNSSNNLEINCFLTKIDKLMDVLDRSSRIEQTTHNIQISRKTTRRNLQLSTQTSQNIQPQSLMINNNNNNNHHNNNNKQNINRTQHSKQNTQTNNKNRKQQNTKTNKQLVLELREKQLKISQLQEKLSRKDIEIECQKKVINMLRNINISDQGSKRNNEQLIR